jgi:D-alanyl-D-alanine carboxypeptidase/D-alanyl-D-alanine-endopeptidase (penicillin-binding protein 4)
MRSKQSFSLLLCSICLFYFTGFAQSPLQQAANALANQSAFKHGRLTLCVIDVASGKVLASIEEEKSVTPASSLKLLTTASALELLGADYRFNTVLEHSGTVNKQGQLNGNLFIKGYGDPSLGADFLEGSLPLDELLERFSLSIQRAGISEIKGQIIGDASAFESAAYGRTWQWEDMGNYYAAGVWGLNIHENLHFLTFQQQPTIGQKPTILSIEPDIPGLRFTNELTSASRNSGDNAYIFGAPYQFSRYIRGSIPAGSGQFTIKGSIPDPPLLMAQLLTQRLSSIGIKAAGSGRLLQATPNTGRKRLYTHSSPPLEAIVSRANYKSINLYCEAMLKAIAMESSGEQGSTEQGIKQIQKLWQSKGLSMNGTTLVDGSGLSEANRVTAEFMAQMLTTAAKENKASFKAFYDSIPVAGRTGSMKNRLKGTAAEQRLRAKSGTLEGVRALAGYAKKDNGQLLAYAIFANDYQGKGGQVRNQLEQFLIQLFK